MIHILKGMFIGIANIIPGVSGGTFALIMGIYTRLINALGAVDIEFLRGLSRGRFKEEFIRIDGLFLIQITAGALFGIALFSWPSDYFLSRYPGMTLAFFSGLIIPSLAVPYRMIEKKNISALAFALAGLVLVIAAGTANPAGSRELSLPFVFAAGAIGMSAMVLPGLSGSVLMLILGVYGAVISNIKEFTSSLSPASMLFLTVFGLGCIAGVILFVRLMKYMLSAHRSSTLSFLTGLVAGSLYLLWPFKDYSVLASGGSISTAVNILPASSGELIRYLAVFAAGAAGSLGIERLADK